MLNFKDFILEEKTTLRFHDVLNPLLWDKNILKPEVNSRLLKIADVWRDFAKIPKEAVKDILFTGGNANYNYTKFSDIDLHLFLDKKEVADCDKEILDDFLKDKKSLWSLNHDIKIYGIPVEIYAQDVKEATSSDQGVYSLVNQKWLKKPKKTIVDLEDTFLLNKIKNLKDQIDNFIDSKSEDIQKMNAFKEKIKNTRAFAVQKGGEFSLENLAFKELRNLGYIDKLSDYIKKAEDKKLTLEKKR
jgi:hypothetical protein